MKPEKGVACLRTIQWDECGKLCSPVRGEFVWRPDGIEEMLPCDKGHTVPDEHCSCGLYATFDLAVLSSYMISRSHIVTLCISHGDGWLHEYGLRAKQLEVLNVVWYHKDDDEMTYRQNKFTTQQMATLAAAQYFGKAVIPMRTAMQVVEIQFEAWKKWNEEQAAIDAVINQLFQIGGK